MPTVLLEKWFWHWWDSVQMGRSFPVHKLYTQYVQRPSRTWHTTMLLSVQPSLSHPLCSSNTRQHRAPSNHGTGNTDWLTDWVKVLHQTSGLETDRAYSYFSACINLSLTYLLRHSSTYLQPQPTQGGAGNRQLANLQSQCTFPQDSVGELRNHQARDFTWLELALWVHSNQWPIYT